jgi:hypothetical protein
VEQGLLLDSCQVDDSEVSVLTGYDNVTSSVTYRHVT